MFKKGPSESEKELEKNKEHIAGLERKVGQLTYEVDWLKKNLKISSDPTGRKNNVDFSDQNLTISRQAELLSINQSSVYRNRPKEKTISDEDLFIMRRIDELHTAHPTWGYRTITKVIRRDDKICVNRKMREMGVYTIYPKPNLSKRLPCSVYSSLSTEKVEYLSPGSGLGSRYYLSSYGERLHVSVYHHRLV